MDKKQQIKIMNEVDSCSLFFILKYLFYLFQKYHYWFLIKILSPIQEQYKNNTRTIQEQYLSNKLKVKPSSKSQTKLTSSWIFKIISSKIYITSKNFQNISNTKAIL